MYIMHATTTEYSRLCFPQYPLRLLLSNSTQQRVAFGDRKKGQVGISCRLHTLRMTVTSTSAAITKFRPAQERNYHLEDARKVANYIKAKTTHEPEVAVVLSSRLTQGFALVLEEADRIPYEEIQQEVLPNFPTCSVAPAKDGAFIFGSVDGVSVLVMFGRFHTYEGHSSQATAFPMRVMKELGIQTVILTNASRGLSPTLEIGDVM